MLVSECKKCKPCIYYGRLANQCRFCSYIIFNEHSRGCPVGEDCIRYEKGKPLELPNDIVLTPSRGGY